MSSSISIFSYFYPIPYYDSISDSVSYPITYVYIVVSIIVIILLRYLYLKLVYGFWYYQPVFHPYDLKYYFFPCGIIDHNLPEKNRYTNFTNIKTINFNNLTSYELNKFISFIKINFHRNGENKYLPNKENIVPYFKNHEHNCYFSFYYENILLHDVKTNSQIEEKKLIGVITGRPLNIIINNGNKDAVFDSYYIDYLCVDTDYRKQNIAPQLIQTHEYNQRHLNKNITTCLFKREGKLTAIVPLCVYNSYCFSVERWTKPPELDPCYKLLRATKQNIFLLVDSVRTANSKFDIIIKTKIGNIIELIETSNMYIYFLIDNNNAIPISLYLFKKSCMYIQNNLEALTCIGSIDMTDYSEQDYDKNLFINAFKLASWSIFSKEKNHNYGYLVLENTSHNNVLINNIIVKTKPNIILPTAHFFYNFAYHTFKPNKVLSIF